MLMLMLMLMLVRDAAAVTNVPGSEDTGGLGAVASPAIFQHG